MSRVINGFDRGFLILSVYPLLFLTLIYESGTPKIAVLQLCYKSSYELNMCDSETIFSYISFLFGLFLIYIIQKE